MTTSPLAIGDVTLDDFRLPLSMASVIFSALVEVFIVADWEHNGTEMITPFPVPIHKRLQETSNAVIRTNENPNLPVPVDEIIEADNL